MSRLLFALFLAAVGLARAGDNLPSRAEALMPKALEAERSWRGARASAEAAEAFAAPLADEVKVMKGVENPSWWQSFKLRRRMAALKDLLDETAARRARERDARNVLFVLLTGIQEELRSALDRELALGHLTSRDLERLRGYFKQKERWDKLQEEVGLGVERPFPDNEALPRQASRDAAWKADQIQALRARLLQMEAWREQLRSDIRVYARAQALKVLDAKASKSKLADFHVLLKAAERQSAKTEAELQNLGGSQSLP